MESVFAFLLSCLLNERAASVALAHDEIPISRQCRVDRKPLIEMFEPFCVCVCLARGVLSLFSHLNRILFILPTHPDDYPYPDWPKKKIVRQRRNEKNDPHKVSKVRGHWLAICFLRTWAQSSVTNSQNRRIAPLNLYTVRVRSRTVAEPMWTTCLFFGHVCWLHGQRTNEFKLKLSPKAADRRRNQGNGAM